MACTLVSASNVLNRSLPQLFSQKMHFCLSSEWCCGKICLLPQLFPDSDSVTVMVLFFALYNRTSPTYRDYSHWQTTGTLPLVPVAAYINCDITHAWALQYVWLVYGV